MTVIETDEQLWAIALAKVKEIKSSHGTELRASNRGPALWCAPNPLLNVTTHLTIYLTDGEVLLYVITVHAPFTSVGQREPTVKVERYLQRDESDKFWARLVEVDEQDQLGVVVNGVHYRLGPDRKGAPFKGFDGRRWEIEYLDGRPSVVTNDLWYQGRVPERYRVLLPDNARFMP